MSRQRIGLRLLNAHRELRWEKARLYLARQTGQAICKDCYERRDEALQALAEHYARLAKVVELRFFVGLSVTEAALVLDVNERTVRRDWEFAKSWLLTYLKRERA